MKRGTVFGILFAVISIIALGLLTVYLSMNFRMDTFIATTNRIESEADAAMQALYASQTEKETEAPQTEVFVPQDPIIWVGDSRTLGMQDAIKNPEADIFIGAAGEGYTWLAETGLPELKEAMTQFPEAPVVFNFGVNDYDNLSSYMALYQELTAEYADTTFYFLSVNPIEPTLCKNITNEEISDFNAHLKADYPDTYIDTFTFLMIEQVVPFDGVHYSEEDYQRIYDFAAARIK